MTANVPFPLSTGVGQGLFADASAAGLVQGTAYPDPSSRFRLRGGYLANSETIPMWGGCGVYASVPGGSGGPFVGMGPIIGRATSYTGGSYPLAGFSVSDQNYSAIIQPDSNVPMSGSGMQVNYYPFGSFARIAVACDPALVDLRGGPLAAAVAWDYVNQLLIPATGAITVSSGTYNSTTGEVTLTLASAANLSPGDSVTVSSATGTGSFADINGTFTTGPGTTGSTVTYTIATGLTLTITGGSLTTGVAINVQVLDVQPTGCLTVEYDSETNTANYNFNGSCAVIQI